MSYPPNAGWFETPIPDMLLRCNEMLQEAEARAREAEARYERLDEALALLEWTVAEYPAFFSRHEALLTMLGQVGQRGATGLTAEWLREAGERMERAT